MNDISIVSMEKLIFRSINVDRATNFAMLPFKNTLLLKQVTLFLWKYKPAALNY